MNLCGAIFFFVWLANLCCTQGKDVNGNPTSIEWKGAPELETFGNYEEMESFFNTTQKIPSLENPKNDTYIEAYNLHHIKSSKTASRLNKRSTPEFIKFELSDVKEPDESTREFFKKIQNSLNISQPIMPPEKESEEHSGEEKVEDLVAIQKRSIDIHNTGGRKKQKKSQISNTQFNTIMKLLIDINQPSARKQRNNEPSPPVVPYAARLDRRYTGIAPKHGGHHLNQFGEKYKQYPSGGSRQFVYSPKLYQYPALRPNYVTSYVPFSVAAPLTNLQTTAPEVSQIRSISRPEGAQLAKVLPEINYVIKEVQAPDLKVTQPISHQYSSGATDQTSEIDYRNHHFYAPAPAPAPAKAIPQEQQLQIGYATHAHIGKEINNEHLLRGGNDQLIPKQAAPAGVNPAYPDPTYGSLMTLVGKSPADQLYGLTYILGKELHLTQRPEDSTAPMVFHPDGGNGIQNAGGAPGDHLSYGPEDGILEQPQSIKPITEAPEEEIQAAPFVHVTPQPVPTALSYKQLHSALSPNYDLQDSQKELQQYASRYAFGYHVRDFHSGNDYSHRQNRDVDGITRGQYHVLLPDGRIQNVIYHADKSGFHADVSFETGSGHH